MDRADVTAILRNVLSDDADHSLRRMLQWSAGEPTHPMFAQDRWTGISNQDYVRIAPALHLASRLLQSYEVKSYLATYLHAPRTPAILPKTGTMGVRFARVRDPANPNDILPMTFQEESAVDALLLQVSQVTSLQFSTTIRLGFGTHGVCTSGALIQPGNPGRACDIEIEVICLRAFDNMPTTISSSLLANWFNLAVTLVHESMHAAAIHTVGVTAPEPLFETDNDNELGESLEALIFRGLPVCWPVTPVHPQHVVAAPGTLLLTVPHRVMPNATSGEAHSVQDRFLRLLFDDDFWTSALRISEVLFPNMRYHRSWTSVLYSNQISWV